MHPLNKTYKILFCCFLFFNVYATFSQDKFILQGNLKKNTISFKMVNNLMIIPVEVNGSKLNFLLDTGVNNTLMFNLSVEDSLKLKNTRKIKVRGLGEGNFIDAVQSKNNTFKIGKVVNNSHMTYLIPGKEFDLSARLGIDVNGIIGGDLFRDMVVEVNYSNKRIKFYNSSKYEYKKCRKCETFNLTFYKGKPYIDIKVKDDGKIIDAKLLIDTGGSKTIWLFDKSSDAITLPEKYFNDFLGRGLSGNIYGRRSKIDEVIIGKHIFKDANVAYPDSLSIPTAYEHKERNGSLGAGILKRFRILLDYRDKKIVFKGKSKFYKNPFTYNKSGLEVIHGGKMLVKNKKPSDGTLTLGGSTDKPIVQIISEYVYDFKPVFAIANVRKDSPAAIAGLREKDIILEVNGKLAYNYKLEEITHLFSQEEGKKIRLLIERHGVKMLYEFRLKNML